MKYSRPPALAGLLWGFAEATLFFVVPDVLITWVALFSLRRSAVQLALVIAGSLIGGALMYAWGAKAPETARAAVERIPFVTDTMFHSTADDLRQSGASAMLHGPLSGIPYKVYAVQAPAYTSFPAFLAVSIPARLERIVPSWLAFAALGTLLRRRWPQRLRLGVIAHLAFWGISYLWYWGRT